MTEEKITILANNPNTDNTFTLNSPASTATATIPWTTIPWTWPPNYYTTGYMYAQLSEQQLGDLESRFRKVMRSELKFLLSQVLDTLEDEDSEDDEDEDA